MFVTVFLIIILVATSATGDGLVRMRRDLVANKVAEAALERLRDNILSRDVEPIAVLSSSVTGLAAALPASSGVGHFRGLRNIRLKGDASIGRNNTVILQARMDTARVNFTCAILPLLGRSLCTQVYLRLRPMDLYLVLRLPTDPMTAASDVANHKPDLDTCDVTDLGDLGVQLPGAGFMGRVLGRLSTMASGLLSGQLARDLQNSVCAAIAGNL